MEDERDATTQFLERFNQIAKEVGASPQVAEIAKDLFLGQLKEWLEQANKESTPQPNLPDAKWKAILLHLYTTIRDQHSPDIWDYWQDPFEQYRGDRERIAEIVNKIYEALNLHDDEAPIKEKVNAIGEVAGESFIETMQTIERILAKEGIDVHEYEYEPEVGQESILETILTRAEEYLKQAPKKLPQTPETRYIQKTIKIATSPKILEELADYYDSRLYKLTEVAERIPLWIASSYAPPIRTGYGRTNSSINVLMIGETGTGKTTIKKLVEPTAPKYITADVFTTPSFTGTAYRIGKTWDIKEGYIPQAHNGILAIPEIDKILKDPKLEGAIRESVEKMTLLVTKAGVDKNFDCKYGLLLDSNFAGNDYFEDGTTIYNQMGTTRRLLSRIDDPIPFAYIRIRDIEGLVEFEQDFLLWNWKKEQANKTDEETRNVRRVFEKIRDYVTKEINCVGVQISPEQGKLITKKMQELIKTYHDIEIIRGRQYMTVIKFIYASTILHAYNRKTIELTETMTRQTILVAEKKDVETALEAIEIIVRNQGHILREGRKHEIFKDYEDMVVDIITESGLETSRKNIAQRLQERKVSKRTAYKIIDKMIQSGKLAAEGEKIMPISLREDNG